MQEPSVQFEELVCRGGKKIGRITLNNPKALNSLSTEMVELMLAQFNRWHNDNSIHCLFICGAGEKAFCAGGDVQALHASAVSNPGGPCNEAEHFFALEYRLDYMIHRYNKPIVAWGDGIVMGGGLGIFAGASHRVVTETSRFAMPEITIGLYPDVGGSYFLNLMPGKAGRFLALTGASFNAPDSMYTGIADYFICREYEHAVIDALTSFGSQNKNVSDILSPFFEQSKPYMPPSNIQALQPTIDSLCSDDETSTVLENFANLQTDDPWLIKAKESSAHGSPLSIALTDRHLKHNINASLADIFRRDITLSTNIVRYPEFSEGVRALLIDKDKQPQWQFSDIKNIPSDLIAQFFKSPWDKNPLDDL